MADVFDAVGGGPSGGRFNSWGGRSPAGVYYHQPSDPKSAQPRQKWFVAIAVKVTALSKIIKIASLGPFSPRALP